MKSKIGLLVFLIVLTTFFACSTEINKETSNSNSMLKLYKVIDNQLYYWETWEQDSKTAVVHWGIVGQRGQNKEIKGGLFSNFKKVLQKEIDYKVKEGFAEFDEDNMTFLEVEYKIEGFGSEKDLDKRHKLEQRLNELLGWTGLGHVDGGSIGSGSMEAGCIVVDFEVAKKVIENDLKNTEFSDYSRIFKMGE